MTKPLYLIIIRLKKGSLDIMKSSYVCLNSKTFEIEENNIIIPVDRQLAKAISTLNQKGYYVEMFNKATIATPFSIGSIIYELTEQQLLNINDSTKNKIKKIIENSNNTSTFIVFKEEYKFDSLPLGYKIIGRELFYSLDILKDNDDIEIKKLIELDKEHQESIKNLENWANDLPSIIN